MQVAALLKELERPLSEDVRNPAAWLLHTLRPMLRRDGERGRRSRPLSNSPSDRCPSVSFAEPPAFSECQARSPADAAPAAGPELHSVPAAWPPIDGHLAPAQAPEEHASSSLHPNSVGVCSKHPPSVMTPRAHPQRSVPHAEVDTQPAPPQGLAATLNNASSESCPSPVVAPPTSAGLEVSNSLTSKAGRAARAAPKVRCPERALGLYIVLTLVLPASTSLRYVLDKVT